MPRGRSRPAGQLSGVFVGLIFLAAFGGSAAAGVIEFPLPSAVTQPAGIVTGPDGNLWLTDFAGSRIWRMTPAGIGTEFVLAAGRGPLGIALGPDGKLYFTERLADSIGRIDPLAGDTAAIQASIVEFAVPGAGSGPHGITAGPDGNLWFTEFGADQIGRLTIGGVIFEFPAGPPGGGPAGITVGPDGALWYTVATASQIGRMTTAGTLTNLFPLDTGTDPEGIALGADGALWYTNFGRGTLGRITTAGAVSELPLGAGGGPLGVAAGGDGALWATLAITDTIARVTTSGVIAGFGLPTPLSQPTGIAVGPDGAVWLTEAAANRIGRMPLLRTLAVVKAGSGSGAVTSVPTGIDCGATCAADFEESSTVTLSGTPVQGSVLREWSGGGCVGSETCPVSLMGPTAVTATFAGDLVNVAVNRPQFTPGLTLRVAASMNDPGLPNVADVLFGALLPDGDTILFITPTGPAVGQLSNPASYRALAAGISLAAPIALTLTDVLVYTWGGGEPPGVYVLFVAAIDATTGSFLGLSTAGVTLGP
jgi:virginiamycin B lyase